MRLLLPLRRMIRFFRAQFSTMLAFLCIFFGSSDKIGIFVPRETLRVSCKLPILWYWIVERFVLVPHPIPGGQQSRCFFYLILNVCVEYRSFFGAWDAKRFRPMPWHSLIFNWPIEHLSAQFPALLAFHIKIGCKWMEIPAWKIWYFMYKFSWCLG